MQSWTFSDFVEKKNFSNYSVFFGFKSISTTIKVVSLCIEYIEILLLKCSIFRASFLKVVNMHACAVMSFKISSI